MHLLTHYAKFGKLLSCVYSDQCSQLQTNVNENKEHPILCMETAVPHTGKFTGCLLAVIVTGGFFKIESFATNASLMP